MAVDEAVQIHCGAGDVDDSDVERFYRDAKITRIYEGTAEIRKNVVARELPGKGFRTTGPLESRSYGYPSA